jgi:hypothetical protein
VLWCLLLPSLSVLVNHEVHPEDKSLVYKLIRFQKIEIIKICFFFFSEFKCGWLLLFWCIMVWYNRLYLLSLKYSTFFWNHQNYARPNYASHISGFLISVYVEYIYINMESELMILRVLYYRVFLCWRVSMWCILKVAYLWFVVLLCIISHDDIVFVPDWWFFINPSQ